MSKELKKKTEPELPSIHDFEKEKIFRGYLLSEGPEFFTFEPEDEGEDVNIEKYPALVSGLNHTINGVRVKETDTLIEIEYLGKRTNGDKKFAVSVEQ